MLDKEKIEELEIWLDLVCADDNRDRNFVSSLVKQYLAKGDLSRKQWHWVDKMHYRYYEEVDAYAKMQEEIASAERMQAAGTNPAPAAIEATDDYLTKATEEIIDLLTEAKDEGLKTS